MSAQSDTRPGVVVILGMHRSGTSCLAGSLQQAGLFLGGVNEAAPFNPKGNRENRAIMDLHESLLSANEGGWDRPPRSVTWSAAHQARRDRLIAGYPTDRTWGFKDPRTLLALDGWLAVLPRARCIGTFRHPLAVWQSLSSRNRFSRDKSLHLWETYNRLLLDYQSRLGFDLICFDWPAPRYRSRLEQIARRLGLDPPASGFSFFESSLRRNQAPPDEPLPESVATLYRALEDVAA